MAGPWERYQTPIEAPAPGPWSKYAAPAPREQTAEEAMASLEGQKLAGELRNKADRMLLEAAGAESPVYAGLSSAANTAFLNIPRNIKAGIMSMQSGKPFAQEYSYVRDVDEAAARQSPWASGAGTVAGVVGQVAALPVAPAASLAGRMAQGAAIGAGASGAAELADTKDLRKAGEAALGGAVIGGAAAPVVTGLAKAANAGARAVGLSKAPAIPSTDDLSGMASAAYKAADDAGVIVNRDGIRGVAGEIKSALANEAYHPENQPKLSNFLGELESLSVGRGVPGQPPNVGVTLSGLETTRKMLRAARSSAEPEERRLAKIAADRFDDYLSNLSPSEVAAGKSKEGFAALKEARSLWSSYRKADMVDEALQAAQQRAQSTGSGGNIDNALRQEFRKILTSRKKSAGFSEAEKAALAKIVIPGKGQNTLRLLGKLAPQGDGLRMMLSLGAAGASGGASLPVSALGAGAKALADNATKRNVERLSQVIRARGLDIDPQDIVKAAETDRLRNFFTSIGINVGKLADGIGGEIASTARGLAPGQLPARADDENNGVVPPARP